MADKVFMPSTMIQKRDYGIKIARRGYDARYASDNNLLYNSSFPVLAIAQALNDNTEWEGTETGEYQHWLDGNGRTIPRWRDNARIPHGLDYVPFVTRMGYDDTTDNYVLWDEKYIYHKREFYNVGDYDKHMRDPIKRPKLLVIAININRDIEYPYLDDGLPIVWGEQYDYGLKHILSDNPSTDKPDDLGLNANVQSMMAVAVKIATPDKINECLYRPNRIPVPNLSAFCFIQTGQGLWREGGASTQAARGFRVINNSYYEIDGHRLGSKCSLVVVRSPMIAPKVDTTTHVINM